MTTAADAEEEALGVAAAETELETTAGALGVTTALEEATGDATAGVWTAAEELTETDTTTLGTSGTAGTLGTGMETETADGVASPLSASWW